MLKSKNEEERDREKGWKRETGEEKSEGVNQSSK